MLALPESDEDLTVCAERRQNGRRVRAAVTLHPMRKSCGSRPSSWPRQLAVGSDVVKAVGAHLAVDATPIGIRTTRFSISSATAPRSMLYWRRSPARRWRVQCRGESQDAEADRPRLSGRGQRPVEGRRLASCLAGVSVPGLWRPARGGTGGRFRGGEPPRRRLISTVAATTGGGAIRRPFSISCAF